ncbi:MAG: hypothetical protein Q9174_004949 [Haloplaca sp. 1 TL-2023]
MSQAIEKPGEKGADKSGRWTDAEKNALFVSIVASFGTPNWSNVKLPAGRSRMACIHVYYKAMEEAKGVTLGDSKNEGAVKKRGPRKPATGPSPSKAVGHGKRGRKAVSEPPTVSDDSEEERDKKKVKKEEIFSDEEGIEGPLAHEV